jgi:hypothetical protein
VAIELQGVATCIMIDGNTVTGGYNMIGGDTATGSLHFDRWRYGDRRLRYDRRCNNGRVE